MEQRIDVLDNVATFSVLLYILAGIFFERLEEDHWLSHTLVFLVLIVNVFVLGAMFYLTQQGVRELRTRSIITTRVSKQAIWAAISCREQLKSVAASKECNLSYEICKVHMADRVASRPAKASIISSFDEELETYPVSRLLDVFCLRGGSPATIQDVKVGTQLEVKSSEMPVEQFRYLMTKHGVDKNLAEAIYQVILSMFGKVSASEIASFVETVCKMTFLLAQNNVQWYSAVRYRPLWMMRPRSRR
jgi:hypothetical protein